MKRGKYIVVEGNDGTGKSTQVELLAKWLKEKKGIDSFIAHEPAGTPIADAIRSVIKNGDLSRDPDTNLLLFTASRHDIWRTARKHLEKGEWVLSARNYFSTIVFQGYAEGLDISKIVDLTTNFTDEIYMNPDHAIVLTLTADERNKRILKRGALSNKDTFESRGEVFQAKLDEGYLRLAAEKQLVTIDASNTIENIQNQLRDLIF